MIKANKLAHVVLNVTDAQASKEFYMKALGLEVASETDEGRVIFLTLGEEHHDLALFQRATGPRPDKTQPGLVHMAWQLDDFAAVRSAYKELKAQGIEAETIQHNVTQSLYISDPDGNTVELYCDRWENGLEVMNTQGPKRSLMDIETGEALVE